MWIETSKDDLQALANKHTLGEAVEFSDNNLAQVRQEVGESLLDHYDDSLFWEHKP